jgi:hypothetical protein
MLVLGPAPPRRRPEHIGYRIDRKGDVGEFVRLDGALAIATALEDTEPAGCVGAPTT